MTPDPTNPRLALEASLTALLLGELPPDQAAFLRQAITTDPELAKMYARLERTINLVRQTAAEPAPQPAAHPQSLKLSSDRREQLHQRFKTVNHPALAKPERKDRSWLVPTAIAASLLLLAGAMLLPALSKAKLRGQRTMTLTHASDNSPGWVGALENNKATPAPPPDQYTLELNRERFLTDSRPTAPAPNKGPEAAGRYILSGQSGGAATFSATPPTTIFLPPTLPESESELARTAKALDSSSAGNPFFSIDPAARSVSGFGGGGGGGAPGTTPAEIRALDEPRETALALSAAPANGEALAKRYGLRLPNSEAKEPQAQPGTPLITYSGQDRAAGVPAAGTEIYRGVSVLTNGRIEMQPVAPEPAQWQAGNTLLADNHALSFDLIVSNLKSAVTGKPTLGDSPSLGTTFKEAPAQQKQEIAVEQGVNEAVLQQAYRIQLRERLADAKDAQSKNDLSKAAKLYGSASDLASKIGSDNVEFEMAQIRDGQAAVRAKSEPDQAWRFPNTAPESQNAGWLGVTKVAPPTTAATPGLAAPAAIDPTTGLPVAEAAPSVDPTTALPLPRRNATEPLVTRVIKIDPTTIKQGLEGVIGFDWGSIAQSSGGGRGLGGGGGGGGQNGGLLLVPRVNLAGNAQGGGIRGLTRTNDSALLQAEARQLFLTMGVDLSPSSGKSVYYNDREGTLIVRAKPEDLDTIQQAVDALEIGKKEIEKNRATPPGSNEASQPSLYARTNLLAQNRDKQTVYSKLNRIRLDSTRFENLPLREVVTRLSEEARKRDPEKRGVNFAVNEGAKAKLPEGAQPTDPTTGLPLKNEAVDVGDITVNLPVELRDVTLGEVLDAVVKTADRPIKYSVENSGIVFSPVISANTADDTTKKLVAITPPLEPQPEVQTRENAFSTFSLNVSDVSFKLAAASLEKGVLPEPASIRSEEFINAFDYRDPEPAPGAPIAFAWERARYPFTQNRDLLRFSLKTAALGRQAGRPLNLVLLLDNSGSMERADRVDIIREALRVLATQLQPQDTFSVVLFARTPRLWVDGVPGNQAGKVADDLSGLTPEGGTNLGDALDLAYQTALRHYLMAGINRVVLLTDGAANLGNVEPEELKKKVEANRKQGIALDGFGIGWEGYNDDLLEVLTRNGDGRYGFINTPEEAATEFAGQLAGALHVAASDVKVQVEFNPSRVTAYRQIGYAKHQLTKEQFRDNSVDAAELGAAESGNALYVVDVNGGGDGPLATVRVRYKVPGTMQYQEHEWTVPYTGNAAPLEQASPALRLAASASAFSEWLATSPYAAEVTPDSVLGYLRGVPEVYGADARPKKLEWMIRQAKSLVGNK